MDNLEFSFDGVQAATGVSMTMPGTVGLFNISKVEFVESNVKKTTGMKQTYLCKKVRLEDGSLVDEASSFNHTYWMSPGALPRVQYLAEVLLDQKFAGNMTKESLISAFEGKDIALKVIGQVNEEKGKGYPDLAFAGFAKKASEFLADPSILQFDTSDRRLIEEAMNAIKSSRSSNADQEGASAPAPGASSKPF